MPGAKKPEPPPIVFMPVKNKEAAASILQPRKGVLRRQPDTQDTEAKERKVSFDDKKSTQKRKGVGNEAEHGTQQGKKAKKQQSPMDKSKDKKEKKPKRPLRPPSARTRTRTRRRSQRRPLRPPSTRTRIRVRK